MKTILVVYSHDRLTKKEYQTLKRYSFNTNSKVNIGDRFETEEYYSPMQIVEVMPKAFKYVHTYTGDLSNVRKNSTKQFEIREIVIQKEINKNIIQAIKLND